jgi:hypothetical protein
VHIHLIETALSQTGETQMTKTAAIKTARDRVSQIMPFGGGYVYNHYEPGVGTRQSNIFPYQQALSYRKAALYGEAAAVYCKSLGQSVDDCAEAEMWASQMIAEKPYLSIHAVLDIVSR